MDRKKKSSNTETSSVISSGVIPIASLPTPELNKKQRTSESACYALGAWNIFRLSVFLACTAILFYQANEFRKRFYTYPTSVNIGKTSFSKRGSFPLPAVTVCFENHFKESFTELDRNRFVTCFSKNLHLYDGEEGTFADNYGVKEDPSPDYLLALHLKILPWELTIDPWHAPRIFFALHSPFEPVNPVHDGVTLSVESDYFMQITRLEEDHLLPYPYRTNCLDYEALWKENNRTGPRSQKLGSTVAALSSAEICSERKSSCLEARKKCNSIFRVSLQWRILNVLTFSVCTIVLLYQSSEFLKRFYEYPTNIKIEKTSFSTRDAFPIPAFTVCYRTPPETSSATNTLHCVRTSLLPHIISVSIIFIYVMELAFHGTLKTSFVKIEGERFAKCYSDNLHLNDNEKERIFEKRGVQVHSAEVLFDIHLNIVATEVLFQPWIFPHAYFAIHSPFEPINPVHSGERLRLGKHYFVTVTRLEEDHLLPYPYQTDCMDYEGLNKENNMTGPRSQEICLDLCRAEYYKKCRDCNAGLRMYETLDNYCGEYDECFYDIFEDMSKITEKCHAKCKPDCRKLKYHYKIAKFTIHEKTNRSITAQELLARGQ
ncbi:hypothetical protein HNY73_015526 [Argiope bruennichi]|uniref:Uncharacterized protein n=1 Tax=Argiope bruennichi TaxID=94029 RepID=A0A8T0ESJ6_ARGBR|nr:hypothetical protein HNY73_015526 [Argiope bruennichi]